MPSSFAKSFIIHRDKALDRPHGKILVVMVKLLMIFQDNERDHKKTDRRKRSRSKESTKRRIHSSSPDPKASKSSQNRKHSEKKKISPSKTERTSKSSPAKSDKISKVETKKPGMLNQSHFCVIVNGHVKLNLFSQQLFNHF